MAKYSIEDSTLTGIADAIREKEGTTDAIPVADFAARIAAIETGGGSDKLPEGYKQLEYIESTGTQYIDTGYVFTSQNIRVDLDFEFTGAFNGSSLFGAQNTSTKQFNIATYGSPHSFYVGTSSGLLPLSLSQNERYSLNVQANNGTLTVDLDGAVSTANYSGSLDNTTSFTLFAYNYSGTIKQFASARFYSVKIYDNGNLVRDFVPCTNASGVAGLYDLVSKAFYGNGGSGEFDTPFSNSPVLLWTNASPTSNFASGTKVYVSGAGYSAYIVEVRFSTSDNMRGKGYVEFKATYQAVSTYATSSSNGFTSRIISAADRTGVTFENGIRSVAGVGAGYEYAVPTRIWGVKFTL